MPSELWVIRHGETEWSRDGKHTSRTEVELTPEGEDVARGLADRLDGVEFDLVLTSPRLRTRRTAELAGFADAHVEDDLAEWDYGDYEGITSAEIRERRARLDGLDAPVSRRGNRRPGLAPDGPRGGEGAGRRWPGAGVQPGHASRALAARWLELPVEDGRHFLLGTATISVLGYERESPVVARWNS